MCAGCQLRVGQRSESQRKELSNFSSTLGWAFSRKTRAYRHPQTQGNKQGRCQVLVAPTDQGAMHRPWPWGCEKTTKQQTQPSSSAVPGGCPLFPLAGDYQTSDTVEGSRNNKKITRLISPVDEFKQLPPEYLCWTGLGFFPSPHSSSSHVITLEAWLCPAPMEYFTA